MPESRQLIQVAQNLDLPATREREVRALTDAMRVWGSPGADPDGRQCGADRGNGMTIEIRSLVEWLLQP